MAERGVYRKEIPCAILAHDLLTIEIRIPFLTTDTSIEFIF